MPVGWMWPIEAFRYKEVYCQDLCLRVAHVLFAWLFKFCVQILYTFVTNRSVIGKLEVNILNYAKLEK